MASSILKVLTPLFLLVAILSPDIVTGKPSAHTPPAIYPYTLTYKLGEFQGEVYYGAPEGTVVAAKGTLGQEKYHPLYIGVEVGKTVQRKRTNPFQSGNTIDDQSDKNSTHTVAHEMETVVMGTTMFALNGNGNIFVRRDDEIYSLNSWVCFYVVLVQKDDGEIRSNPLSFVVQVIAKPNSHEHNKNAITAGILVLLILFIGGLTLAAINCKNWRSGQATHNQKFTSTACNEDIDIGWKDHYHIKAEDSIIMGKDRGSLKEVTPRDGKKERPPLVRVDSSLSWLKLHSHSDQDVRDCGHVNLPTISEICEESNPNKETNETVKTACNGMVNGSVTFVNGNSVPMSDDQSKSILKKHRHGSRHSHIKTHSKQRVLDESKDKTIST